MSRRDEVESEMKEALRGCDDGMEYAERLEDKCLLLADEVHAEREVVTKLLAMLEPGVSPPKSHQSCSCVDCRQHEINEGRYHRALEIAGRKE